MLFKTMLSLLTFVWGVVALAQSVQILSPKEGQIFTTSAQLNMSYKVITQLQPGDRFVVFRSANNTWPKMNVVKPSFISPADTLRELVLTPSYLFCRDVYAIRLMRGAVTLAGPVHFTAGVGACSGNGENFVNLENNQVDLAEFNPANQLNRDTCGSFASVAALEAAYKRLQNISVRMSQHYMHHIIKSSWLTPDPFYLYENQSSFWGGNDTLTALKFMSWYPLPALQFAPYQDQNQLRTIINNVGGPGAWNANPQLNLTTQDQIDLFEYDLNNIAHVARLNARYGVSSFEFKRRPEARDTTIIENYLKDGKEVMLSVILNWSNDPNAVKTMNYNDNVNLGAHLMLIVGYDKTNVNRPYFLIKNSWGEGILRVSYDLIRNSASGIGVINQVKDITNHNPSHWIGKWEMKHDQWRGKLILRRNYEVNVSGKEPGPNQPYWPRLGEYQHQNGEKYCVWGGWSNGSEKLKMWIDFSKPIKITKRNITWSSTQPAVLVDTRDVCPNENQGQYFEIDMPSRTTNAAGTTWWNNQAYPVTIWK